MMPPHPRRLGRPCSHPGCGAVGVDRFCAAHAAAHLGAERQELTARLKVAFARGVDAYRRRQGQLRIAAGPRRPASTPDAAMIFVCGPPCSGKSTLAQATGRPVLDWDELYSRTTGLPPHTRSLEDDVVAPGVETAFREELAVAARGHAPIVVIRGAPQQRARDFYRERWGAYVIVLEVSPDECVRRLHGTRPLASWGVTEAVIHSWWDRYEPSAGDEVRDERGAVLQSAAGVGEWARRHARRRAADAGTA